MKKYFGFITSIILVIVLSVVVFQIDDTENTDIEVYKLNVLVLTNPRLKMYNEKQIREIIQLGINVFNREFKRHFRKTIEIKSITFKEDTRNAKYCMELGKEPWLEETISVMYHGTEDVIYDKVLGNMSNDAFKEHIDIVPKSDRYSISSKEELAKYLAGVYVDKRELLYRDAIGKNKFYENLEATSINCLEEYIKSMNGYDLTFTNNMLNHANFYSSGVSMLYGGVIGGYGSYGLDSFSVVSFFKYLYHDMEFVKDTKYEYMDKGDFKKELGITMAHELGHSILHLDHTYNEPECLMGGEYTGPPEEKQWKKFYRNIGTCKTFRNSIQYIKNLAWDYFNRQEYDKATAIVLDAIQNNPGISTTESASLELLNLQYLYFMDKYKEFLIVAKDFKREKYQYLNKFDKWHFDKIYDFCFYRGDRQNYDGYIERKFEILNLMRVKNIDTAFELIESFLLENPDMSEWDRSFFEEQKMYFYFYSKQYEMCIKQGDRIKKDFYIYFDESERNNFDESYQICTYSIGHDSFIERFVNISSYYQNNDFSRSIETGFDLLNDFPDMPASYRAIAEFLIINGYFKQKDYASCVKLAKVFKNSSYKYLFESIKNDFDDMYNECIKASSKSGNE